MRTLSPNLYYQPKELVGRGGGRLELSRVSRGYAGTYHVNASNPLGHVTASFIINVLYGPENVQTEKEVTVSVGATVSVECSAAGNPAPTLTWTRAPPRNR
ncbi:hypothetical protein Pmani_039366 [Petrolisthes manimaculis]|uniref:Ig-like domain-containing protein n=1 Tax=Petrolisthes manimaculis TaxID=1843537 RepID=A0AAE1NCR1_9EUCA|nr:hypothetical protein Pmani_039366 [Petrolisthes manimaculis]